MKLCRAALILAVLLSAYVTILIVKVAWPWGLALPALLVVAAKRKAFWSSAYGTARWADADDLRQAGMLDAKEGLILGRLDCEAPPMWQGIKALFNRKLAAREACDVFFRALRRNPSRHMVRLSKAVHTACFAPTGVGKGVSIVIPHLLTCPDAMVVVDFKGELARATAEHRRKMGHRVIMLDPFRVVSQLPDTFNPLDWIDPDKLTAIDDCRDLAEALVIRTGQEKEPHWNDSAELWIAAMCALVVSVGPPGSRSIQTVRLLLTDPQNMEKAVRALCESEAWDGMLARLGHQLTQFKERELGSVLTTTNRFLRFLDTPMVAQSTGSSSFDPADLNGGRVTVYLILPPDHLRAQSALLRMWIGAMLRAVVKGGLGEHRKVQFVLDEAASLGQMDTLGDALDKYRGYGVRLLFMYQSVGQLKKCWGEQGGDQTLLSNVTQVFFGVNDYQTAEYVSNRLGECTIAVDSGGTSSGGSIQVGDNDPRRTYSTSWNTNENWTQAARKLLKPEEVLALDPRTAITFAPGMPPIWTRLLRYYEENFAPRSGFWAGVRIAAGATVCFFLSLLLALIATAGVTNSIK